MWRFPSEDAHAAKGMGDCLSTNFILTYDTTAVLAPNQVQVEGDEGWGFFTGPEFGCVHFQSTSEPQERPR